MANPRYSQRERSPSRREQRLNEYSQFQEGAQRQQALDAGTQSRMMEQLQQMYGLGDAAVRNQIKQSEAEAIYRTALAQGYPEDQASIIAHRNAQTAGMTQQQSFAPEEHASVLAQRGAQTGLIGEQAKALGYENEFGRDVASAKLGLLKGTLALQPFEQQRLQLSNEAQAQQNAWFEPNAQQNYRQNEFDLNQMNPLKLRLAESNISGQNVQNAGSMFDRGLLAPKQAQEVGMPDYYKNVLDPVYRQEMENERKIAQAEFAGKPMDDTTRAALVAKYGEQEVAKWGVPGSAALPPVALRPNAPPDPGGTWGDVVKGVPGAIAEKAIGLHKTFNPWVHINNLLQKKAY
jgi:hypothetical protein